MTIVIRSLSLFKSYNKESDMLEELIKKVDSLEELLKTLLELQLQQNNSLTIHYKNLIFY